MAGNKTAIITGASGRIGSGLVTGFLNEGYNVVATSRGANRTMTPSASMVLVDGDITKQETASNTVNAAVRQFGAVDVLVNCAGIFLKKPFIEYTTDDFNALVSTNLLGFFLMTQAAVRQMLKQKHGCVITISAALADQPIAGDNASVSILTKGGLNYITRSLAIEYGKEGIRFNTVAPGEVETSLQETVSEETLETLQPMEKIVEVSDVVGAVLYLARAGQVSGEVLHVDGGEHAGRW